MDSRGSHTVTERTCHIIYCANSRQMHGSGSEFDHICGHRMVVKEINLTDMKAGIRKQTSCGSVYTFFVGAHGNMVSYISYKLILALRLLCYLQTHSTH
jgi:hypothetical protein